jgi:hypothetical protein
MKLIKKAVVKTTIKLDTVHQVRDTPTPSTPACCWVDHTPALCTPHTKCRTLLVAEVLSQLYTGADLTSAHHGGQPGDLGQQGAPQRPDLLQG